MSTHNPLQSSLIDVQDSCLILIDVQNPFLDKLPNEEVAPLVQRILWLVRVANQLGVPLVVTAEDIDRNGSINPELNEMLPPGTKIFNKMVFGLAADPDIRGAVKATGRNTPILLGLETDVCVAQSAIGLLEQGYQVVVVEDAVASPAKAQQYGLSRIRGAGALVSNVKSLFYEWMRTVENTEEFFREFADTGGPGIDL